LNEITQAARQVRAGLDDPYVISAALLKQPRCPFGKTI
jgi:hypothetical protein